VTFADVVRLVGLCLLVLALPLLMFGTSALDCLVVAVVGVGLSQVPGP
jgi:hypothetical protein